jgi:2-(1,2-epoxy-1,2-dihydrophenyl)acetyl-CoA isomerase
MDFQTIEVEQSGPVCILRLNQPERLNAMSLEMSAEVNAALAGLPASARALVITGAGKAFCSGADLSVDPAELAELDFGLTLETHINPMMMQLRDLPIPWVTAVRGAAAGVGCSLALAGDLIVAGEGAYFLQAFSRVGLVPDGGSTHLLARTIGRPRAMEMMLLGDRIPAATALNWGLVNRVVADEAVEDEAIALAQKLANGPRSLAQTRRMIWHALDAEWRSVLDMERREQTSAGDSADAAEGIAAFMQKRKAQFTGA